MIVANAPNEIAIKISHDAKKIRAAVSLGFYNIYEKRKVFIIPFNISTWSFDILIITLMGFVISFISWFAIIT